jgi:hypothetical protein
MPARAEQHEDFVTPESVPAKNLYVMDFSLISSRPKNGRKTWRASVLGSFARLRSDCCQSRKLAGNALEETLFGPLVKFAYVKLTKNARFAVCR